MSKIIKNKDGTYSVPIVTLGNRLQDNFGLRVVEHPAFGGVSDVHADNSYHDFGEAIDVQDWRADVIDGVDWKTRTGNLQALLKGAGPEVIGPRSGDPNHGTHLHLAATDGVFNFNQQQYDVLFGGNAGGKNATFAQLPELTETVLETIDSSPVETAKERVQSYKAFTAGDVVEGFNNNFDDMTSEGLAGALKGAQESIIQKRMDAGENFGGRMVYEEESD